MGKSLQPPRVRAAVSVVANFRRPTPIRDRVMIALGGFFGVACLVFAIVVGFSGERTFWSHVYPVLFGALGLVMIAMAYLQSRRLT